MKRMERMKIYKIYMVDIVADECYKFVVPAFSKEDAIEYVSGNGEIILIEETTDYSIFESKLIDMLKSSGYGEAETMNIIRSLPQIGSFDLQ